jgi:hypothetical protein
VSAQAAFADTVIQCRCVSHYSLRMSDTQWVQTGVASIAAFGTVGALLISVTVLRRQTDLQRRDQASRVSLHLTDEPLQAVVHNGSELPIYSILIITTGGPLGGVPFSRSGAEILLPHTSVVLDAVDGIRREMSGAAEMYSPGTIVLDPFPGLAERLGVEPKMHLLWPVVAFTDAQGVRWTRNNRGELSELEEVQRPKLMRLIDRR